jgi:hypothetical protein
MWDVGVNGEQFSLKSNPNVSLPLCKNSIKMVDIDPFFGRYVS